MKNKIFTTLVLAFAFALSSFAQTDITGTIVDETGEPLIGATVKTANGKVGVITNVDGIFKMRVPDGTKSINVSYVGYNTKNIRLKFGKTKYDVTMDDKATDLKDVVVIGYGTVKKGDVTTAISKVDMDDLEDRVEDNVGTMLQGELAGVTVNTDGGPMGEVRINVRGASSFGSTSTTTDEQGRTTVDTESDASDNGPLYVVDGIIMGDDFDLNTLNPKDIQSVEVLKDASAAAIYGNLAANGVVLVTMRKAKPNEKLSISASASFTIKQAIGELDVMSGDQWTSWINKIMQNQYMSASNANKGAQYGDDYLMQMLTKKADNSYSWTPYSSSYNYPSYSDPRWSIPGHPGLSYVNWQNLKFRTAFCQGYNISVAGSANRSDYRFSLGYTDSQGVVKNTSGKRITMNFNANTSTANGKISLGLTVMPTYNMSDGAGDNGSYRSTSMLSVLRQIPVAEAAAGEYSGYYPYLPYIYSGYSSGNPVHNSDEKTAKSSLFTMRTSAHVTVKPLSWMSLKVQGTWNMRVQEQRTYTPTVSSGAYTALNSDEGSKSEAYFYGTRSNDFRVEATMSLNKTWGKHKVNGVLGWSTSKSVNGFSYRGRFSGFPNDAIESVTSPTYATTTKLLSFSTNSDGTSVSYFGRVIYNFADRYIFNASLRRDGTSAFPEAHRWRTFPAASAAWQISHEPWWPKQNAVKSLKLRFSWGQTGRNNIRTAAFITSMSQSRYYIDNESYKVAYKEGDTVGNDDLEWQTTQSYNLGLDGGIINNRISFSLDYHYSKTENMLYRMDMPSISGFKYMYTNVGANSGWGIDLTLRTTNISKKDFKWTSTVNLGTSDTKVLDLGDAYMSTTGIWSTQVRVVDHPVGEFYLYDYIGVYSQADIDNPNVAKPTGTVNAGDAKMRDVNGDGIIDSNDKIFCGRPTPWLTLGFNNVITWKRWTLTIRANAQFGGHIYSAGGVSQSPGKDSGYSFNRPSGGSSITINMLSKWMDMYYSEAEPGSVPNAMSNKDYIKNSNFYLYSTDFIKLASISLSYRVPMKSSWWVKSATVGFNVSNVARWDRYDAGFSPEGQYVQSGSSSYDFSCYPLARSYSLSLKCGF